MLFHLHFFKGGYGSKGFNGLTVKLIALTSFICCSDHKLFGSKPLPNDLKHDLKVMVKAGTPPKTNGWNLKMIGHPKEISSFRGSVFGAKNVSFLKCNPTTTPRRVLGF